MGRTYQHTNRDVLVEGDPLSGTSAQVTAYGKGRAMSRAGTRSETLPGDVPAAGSRADACIRAAAGVTVIGLAGIAGAISYSHMRALAAGHGETGWQAHAFPLSVDGIEIVASLVLLADRRTGRRSGWLPWAALVAGTTASLAANVAAAGAGPVGPGDRGLARVHAPAGRKAAVRDAGAPPQRRSSRRHPGRSRSIPGRPLVPAGGGDDHGPPAGPVPGRGVPAANGTARTAASAGIRAVPHPVTRNELTSHPGTGTAPPGHGPGTEPGDGEGPATAASTGAGTATGTGTGADPDIAALLPAARAARDRVLGRGGVLTRDTLAAQLRRDGHPVRNARVSQLLTTLKRESPEAPAREAGREPAGAGAGGSSWMPCGSGSGCPGSRASPGQVPRQ